MPPPLLLRGKGGEVLGAVVCPPGCQHPIYVSVGHLVSLPTAVDITLRCCKHRWVRWLQVRLPTMQALPSVWCLRELLRHCSV